MFTWPSSNSECFVFHNGNNDVIWQRVRLKEIKKIYDLKSFGKSIKSFSVDCAERRQYNAKHKPHILYANNDIGCFHHNKIVHMRHLMPLVSRSVAQSKMCKHKKHLGQICESCYCNGIPMEFRVFVRFRDQSMCDYTHTNIRYWTDCFHNNMAQTIKYPQQ